MGVLGTQVLQEFYSAATRKLQPALTPPQAHQVVHDYSDWCQVDTDPLLTVSAGELSEQHSINFWDALDHIETILRECKRQEDAFGPHAVLCTVIAQRELVDSLLDECPDALRPRLLSVYSSMSSSIGTYLFDLDDPVSAMHCCDQARAAAQEARNTELASYALCMMSLFASW